LWRLRNYERMTIAFAIASDHWRLPGWRSLAIGFGIGFAAVGWTLFALHGHAPSSVDRGFLLAILS